jgi:hypothetical protein
MIGKTKTGKSFKGCVDYNITKVEQGKGEILEVRGLRENRKLMIRDFNAGRAANTRLGKCVWHTSLSFQDQLSSEQMLLVARDWMEGMGILNKTQYVILRHTDTLHHHLHIIANRIADDGSTISDSNNWKRSEALCKQLVLKYKLTPVPEVRNENHINRDKLKGRDLMKSDLNRSISKILRECKSVEDFEKGLSLQGFQSLIRYNPDRSIRGISFERDGVKIKGSDINRGYSASNLVKLIEKNAQALNIKMNVSSSDKPTQSQSIPVNPSSAKKLFDQEDEEERKKKKNRDQGYSY